MSASPDRRAVHCGIDEAGLGPLLGPLSIGYAALSLPEPNADPWRLLGDMAGKQPGKTRRLVVADSKRVFARNDKGRRRLEATALCYLALLSERCMPPSDPRELLFGRALRPTEELVARHPWYASLPRALPLEHEPASLELLAALLQRRMAKRGLALLDGGVRVVPAGELNASYAATSNKSLTVWEMTLEALRHLWRGHGAAHPRIVVDRQGGRMRYGPLLARGLPDASVVLLSETDDCSEYRLEGRPDGSGVARSAHLVIVEKAEDRSFPVALASCFAKYARELAMGAFNTYFTELQPGLRPTAGYTTDGRRWLDEARPALERAALPAKVLIRER
jgi:ribonuclease HII